MNNLEKLNYGLINKKIKLDIARWNHFPFFSTRSRIDSVELNILPRLLFLFQSLPVSLPKKQFSEWDKLFSRFIWQGKKPRVRFKTLQLSKGEGGVALPCLQKYFQAAQLRLIVCWCNPEYQARWKDIESGWFDEIPIQATIADENLIKNKKGNQWIKVTLKNWFDIVKDYNLEDSVTVLKWASYDSDFKPNTLDKRFRLWAKKGITAYCSIIDKGQLLDFNSLKEKFNLDSKDFFRYLQLR
ncbi:MAG: hypothetical protein ACRCYE_15110, partial [Sarcina sp.]